MLLGYARVSKSDDSQDTAAQVSALKSAGCTRVFEDRASGGRWDRPELHRLLVWISSGWATRSWSGSSIACPVPSRMAPRPPDPLRPAVTPARTVAPDRLIMRGLAVLSPAHRGEGDGHERSCAVQKRLPW